MRRAKARMAATRKGFAIVFLVSLVTSTAIGLAVYSLDNAYIASKFDLVSYVPDRILAGGDSSILVMTMDHHGSPVGGKPIEVKLKAGNSTQTLWSGRTDSDGFASPVFKAPSESGKVDIVVTSGPEEIKTPTVIDDTIRIIITTDKPVYQPGQTMHVRVLSFSGADPLPEQLTLILEVIDSNGDKIFKKQLTPNEFGISSYDLALSDQMIQGTYTIKAYSGERTATKAVIIKDYVLPKFRVDLLGMQDWYLISSPINGVVDAEYFFGEIVQGSVKVNASVYYGFWKTVYESTSVLTYGQYQFSIPPIQYAIGIPEAQGNGYLQINVSVTDTGGHTETRSKVIAISPQSFAITILTDSCVSGEYSTFKAIVRTPDGKPADNTTVSPRLVDAQGLGTNLPPVVTDSRGIATVTFLYEGQKTAIFFAGSVSNYNSYVAVELGDGTGVKVIPDRSSYNLGDLGEFEIAYSGKSLTSNVYYDVVSRGYVVDRGAVQLSNGGAKLEVQMVPEMEPFAQVRVYKIESNMDVIRDSVTFSVGSGSDFYVQVTADNTSYYPRDDVGIGFKTATGGKPVVAALGISIVDEAVFELSSMFTGFEALVFGLDEQFVQPQYQILSYVYAGAESLPSVGDEVVPELDTGRMDGTWAANKAEAAELKEQAVQSYWISLYLIAGIGLIGLCIWGVRRGRTALVTAALILIIVPVLLLSAVQSLFLGYGGTSSQEQPILVPKGWGIAPAGGGSDFIRERLINDETPTQNTYGGGSSSGTKPTVIRNYFPETWYWNPCLVTGDDGVANISLQAPDSITSWKVDVVASTLDGLVGSGNGSVKVFQPFFIDPDIPVSVVRGDVFPMKVQVYNYLDDSQTVNVTLVQEPWFTLHSNASQQVYLPSGSVSYVEFTIEASMVGWRTITLQASAGNASDTIVKPMRIIPDGTKKEALVNGQIENGTVTKTILLDPSRIEESENAWVKLQGGMEAVLLEGVDAFIQFVTGCGEQSLSTLSIDILAYDTVRQMGTSPEKLFSYESIVNQGIQHELMYLTDATNGKGRGIVWFPGDQDVHPWLTSWGLVAFQDAVNAGFGLDDKIIRDMQSWLMSIQGSDGSWKFPDWGIYEFNNPILKAKTISSTAYIARALLYSGVSGSDGHIVNAVNYIEKHVNEVWNDSFSLALSLLVLHDGGGSGTANIAQRLDSLKHVENSTCYWVSDTNLISDSGWGDGVRPMDMWGGYSSSRVIETTGYAAMALFGEGEHRSSVDGAVKYLLDHRQSLGGWYSTQDTIVAFQALKRVAGGSTIEHVIAKVLVEGTEIFSVEMGAFNRDVTYYVDIRPYLNATTNISVTCAGKGTLLYSIYLAQYVPWPAEAPASPYLTLRVTYDATHIQLDDTVTAHMYLLYSGSAPALKMILVDLRAPMGLSFVLAEFDALRAAGKISSYDSNSRQVVVYLTDVKSGNAVEFDYSLVPLMPIKSTVQDVSAWDMYDPNTMRAETLPVQFEVS